MSGGNHYSRHDEPSHQADIDVPYRERWAAENVHPYFLGQDYCFIREISYPLSYKHGNYRFQDFLTAVEIWNKGTINHPLSSSGFRPEELFFFDTETTGLGGGVGNTIFLLGYASITNDHLVLRQHILPYPGAEIPLYYSFLENVNYKTLVTYNGKAFDWPQVKTRHTLVRDHVPKLPAFGHFDLFHAARRMWKHKLDRLKLSMVEKEVLGIRREGDVPGFLAPMIYFDFIESKNPDGMLSVLKHNEIDILSLVSLYTHLTFQICGTAPAQTRRETYEVGRWFAAIGEKEEAKKRLTAVTERHQDLTAIQATLVLARQAKKDQAWEQAQKLFSIVAQSGYEKIGLEACIELAKIYEHRIIDYQKAFDYCNQAMYHSKLISKQGKLTGEMSVELLQHRQKRLELKLKKFPG